MTSPTTPTDRPAARWLTAAALLLILLAGLFVRGYDLHKESIWWDEFTSVMHLKAPEAWRQSPHYARWNQMVIREPAESLFDFWVQNRSLDPATMPLYYTVEYLWHKWIGRSEDSLRILSVLIGMLVIPLVYLAGRAFYGRGAGLLAALCVALSPIHAQFAQEIRMYGLKTVLAVLSVYTFYRLLQTTSGRASTAAAPPRRWWVLHGAVNLGLFWTHPFAVLVPFTEGLYLLAFSARRWRRWLAWGVMHCVLALPTLAYISTIQFWETGTTSEWMRLPTLAEFAADLFADDCIGLTWQMAAEPDMWARFVGQAAAETLVNLRWVIGRWMALLLALAAGWMTFRAWRSRRASAETERRDWPWTVFLVMWWLVPPLALYVASMLGRPCIMPRYTLHSSLALYLLAGAAIVRLPWRPARIGAAVLVVLFFGYQQMLVLDGPHHPDWESAAAHVRQASAPDDLVVVHNWLWKRVFTYNLGPTPNVVAYADTYDVLAEMCGFYATLPHEDGAPRTVWAVIRTRYFEFGPSRAFEEQLARRGLAWELNEFEGVQHVLVYRVGREPGALPPASRPDELHASAAGQFIDLIMAFWRTQEYGLAVAAAQKTLELVPENPRVHSYLGMALQEQGKDEAAMDAFRRALALDPYDYPWTQVNLGQLLLERGEYAAAAEYLRQAVGMLPEDAWAHACLGRAWVGAGNREKGLEMLEKALELDADDPRVRELVQKTRRPPGVSHE